MKNRYSFLPMLLAFIAIPLTANAQIDESTSPVPGVETINPEGINAAPHFAPVITSTAGKTIYVSGMTGEVNNEATELEEYETQLRQAFEKIALALKAVGASPAHVVRQRILIVGISQEHTVPTRKVMAEFYGDIRPTSTATGTSGLFNPGNLVEVDVTAVIVE